MDRVKPYLNAIDENPEVLDSTGLDGLPDADQAEVSVWEKTIPFDTITTPDIPASMLPVWLGDYADAVTTMVQTPSGLAVMMALSTISTCLQKKYRVFIHDGYSEPVNLWTASVLPPATRKTAVVSAMTDELCAWEHDEAVRLSGELEANEATRIVNQKRIDYLNTQASKQEDKIERASLIQEAADLKKETPDEMKSPRLWTGDVTPERLQNMLVEYEERMSLLADEGGIFEVMGGLYSNGKANIDIFLKAHAGSPVRVDRGQREARLKQPALTFGLAVQPEVITDLGMGSKAKFRGQGALARFLYCVPASNIGSRDVFRNEPIPADVAQAYKDGVRVLLSIPVLKSDDDQDQPRLLRLTPEAMKAWQKFSAYIEANLGPRKEFENIQDWAGKLPGAALRIAGLCHVVEHGQTDLTISRETMVRALDLCELLIPHAQCAFDMLGDSQPISNAKHLLRWIVQEGKSGFNQRACHRANQGRIKRAAGISDALAVLTERNLISGPISIKQETGRASVWFEVNPVVISGGK